MILSQREKREREKERKRERERERERERDVEKERERERRRERESSRPRCVDGSTRFSPLVCPLNMFPGQTNVEMRFGRSRSRHFTTTTKMLLRATLAKRKYEAEKPN